MRAFVVFSPFFIAACAGAPAPMVTAATAPPKVTATGPSLPTPAPVGSGALVVTTKRNERHFPPSKNAHPSTGGFAFDPKDECAETLAWPEVSGGATPEIDAAMNRALKNDQWILGKDSVAQLRACVTGERVKASRGFEIMLNAKGVLAIRETAMEQYEGSIHPFDPGPETWFVFDTSTGKRLTRADLLASSDAGIEAFNKLLDRCLRAYANDVNGGDPVALEVLREKVSLANPDLLVLPTETGLFVAASGYPPPARVLEGQGPTITWGALVQAGAVGSGSAVGRLTAGVLAPKEVCAKPR